MTDSKQFWRVTAEFGLKMVQCSVLQYVDIAGAYRSVYSTGVLDLVRIVFGTNYGPQRALECERIKQDNECLRNSIDTTIAAKLGRKNVFNVGHWNQFQMFYRIGILKTYTNAKIAKHDDRQLR